MSQDATVLLPNLGAEEGDDWRAILREPATRVAARLWSLLHSGTCELRWPTRIPIGAETPWKTEQVSELWPLELGSTPAEPAFDWLSAPGAARAWLMTPNVSEHAREAFGLRVVGPAPEAVLRVHDKAFAHESARALDLLPRALAPLITELEPSDLTNPETLLPRLESTIRSWPDWTGRSFTLKPRLGSSGRGRVAGRGVDALHREALLGALPRLAARGGAMLEPWLERTRDLSVCLYVPPPEAPEALPTLIGSLEMLTTRSGGYRGHCGELDHRGRVFSGHALDESLRGEAAQVAARAREHGFFGPCGIDSFLYRSEGREILRPVVDLNARVTMGLVAAGLVRRALPRAREVLEISPGDRHAFLLALLPAEETAEGADAVPSVPAALIDRASIPVHGLRLDAARDRGPQREEAAPIPWLFFAHELEPLRAAYLAALAC